MERWQIFLQELGKRVIWFSVAIGMLGLGITSISQGEGIGCFLIPSGLIVGCIGLATLSHPSHREQYQKRD